MNSQEKDNILAICLVAGCTQTLGQLWSDSCSAVLDAVGRNVANSLGRGAAEAISLKELPRGRSLPFTPKRGGRGL